MRGPVGLGQDPSRPPGWKAGGRGRAPSKGQPADRQPHLLETPRGPVLAATVLGRTKAHPSLLPGALTKASEPLPPGRSHRAESPGDRKRQETCSRSHSGSQAGRGGRRGRTRAPGRTVWGVGTPNGRAAGGAEPFAPGRPLAPAPSVPSRCLRSPSLPAFAFLDTGSRPPPAGAQVSGRVGGWV